MLIENKLKKTGFAGLFFCDVPIFFEKLTRIIHRIILASLRNS